MPSGMRAAPTSPIGRPDVLWGLPGAGGMLTEWAESVPDLLPLLAGEHENIWADAPGRPHHLRPGRVLPADPADDVGGGPGRGEPGRSRRPGGVQPGPADPGRERPPARQPGAGVHLAGAPAAGAAEPGVRP